MACTFLSSQNKPKKIFYHYFHVTGWKIIDKLWTTISAYSSSLRNLQKLWSLVSNSCSAFPTLQNSNLCIHLSNPAPKILSLTNMNCFSLFGLSWLCWCFLYAQSLDLSSFPFVGIAEIQLFSTSLLSSPVLLNSLWIFLPIQSGCSISYSIPLFSLSHQNMEYLVEN